VKRKNKRLIAYKSYTDFMYKVLSLHYYYSQYRSLLTL